MTEKQLNVTETPIEELECDKKYVYDTGIIFECKDGCKFQILDEDVAKLLNELTTKCSQLEKENEELKEKIKREIKHNQRLHQDNCELHEENEQLKQLLDYADDLIQSHLSEHYIRQWRNFKTGHKEYNDFWEEKLKKHKELKDDVE